MKFYVRFPGDFYPVGPVEADTEKQARKIASTGLGYSRVPRGTEAWEYHPLPDAYKLASVNPGCNDIG